MKSKTESILDLDLPYRDHVSLRRTVFRGGSGPSMAVVSGIHGDEIEGLYVCHRLALWLSEHPKALRGEMALYPAANPLGLATLQRILPVFETDLNRNFPGHAEGLAPQRMAEALMREMRESALVIDIHASNIFLREIPQVRISDAFSKKLVPVARQMNLDVIWVHGSMTVMEATLAHSLNDAGTPCLVVEMGVGMRITPVFAEQVMTGILHAAKSLGVLRSDAELPPLTHQPALANDSNVHYLNAQTSGLFVPEVDHWREVRRGQVLGSIVSAFNGKEQSRVTSPVSGRLFTLREYPLVYEGSLMARIMSTEKSR